MLKIKIFKKILLCLIALFVLIFPATLKAVSNELSGRILIQAEEKGEAWYVYPENNKRYFLGRPGDAFEVMKNLSLGARHEFISSNELFPKRLAGRILLDVETNGEAYYIHPDKLTKHYLGRPADAFEIMRRFGLGITNLDLLYIPLGQLANKEISDINITTPIQSVPFTSQAPFGEWSDQRQQDGCEESSALMAVKWARGENLSKQESKEVILQASDYLLDTYGEYRDISSPNVVDWIFKDYFNYSKVAFKSDIKVDDIIYELNKGNVVITPMDGQKLNNPNFTPPGPTRHMLLVKGYNAEERVFITNDPGTRNGEDYKYDARLFYEAIRDYPTGYHKPIKEVEKNMIVVWK